MAIARELLVPPGSDGFYHCISRCVRRAWLCGRDPFSGMNYEHRRDWIVERLELLSKCFGIDVYSYSIMSNHLHLVIHLRPEIIQQIDDEEVAQRWLGVFSGSKDAEVEADQSKIEHIVKDKEQVKLLRERLSSISWFMRSLNENIARRANAEDECKGRFWEGRFSSQPLLDEAAILTCMTYVDLNPIRAGVTQTIEGSDFTSVQQRIRTLQSKENPDWSARFNEWLAEIDPPADSLKPALLSLSLKQYLELLDHTGRILREDKPGVIPAHLAPILKRLEIEPDRFTGAVKHYGSLFHRITGTFDNMRKKAEKLGLAFVKGIKASRCVFCSKTASP